jgi:hypothetical protein
MRGGIATPALLWHALRDPRQSLVEGSTMLTLSQLQHYDNWVDQTADDVLRSAIAAGGWAKVFPKQIDPKRPPRSVAFPHWASRIRNYFNITPGKLKRLALMEGDKAWRASGLSSFGFTNVAYIDEKGRHWFQMQASATIYHYDGSDGWGRWKLSEALVLGQEDTPVFKLISPDGSGGSREVCIHNPNTDVPGTIGKSEVGPIGRWISIRTKAVINEMEQGSYNYSETGIVGLSAHNYRDVDPHKAKAKFGYYKNPSRYSALSARVFAKGLV